eukprot:CAMPEP_0172166890 /NCGR_PEP_ID=MMETSP1050-20130122/9257_1 /TAXON_ID=233186 /ORGANISM="Cryptomonas curvata, Strain CCAP979/52" /LENGTH=87 /DNA_ID=CAMNT_0012837599 /DNA_START=359 /DNA_END=617 /DNA_ORIENTATION=-
MKPYPASNTPRSESLLHSANESAEMEDSSMTRTRVMTSCTLRRAQAAAWDRAAGPDSRDELSGFAGGGAQRSPARSGGPPGLTLHGT